MESLGCQRMTAPYLKAMRSCPESCFEEEEAARFRFWEKAVLQVADDGRGGGVAGESSQGRRPVLSLK